MSLYRNLVWFTRGMREYTKSGYEAAAANFDPKELDGVRLDNRRILVTGANSGIGLACCKELVKRGAQVHMICRNAQRGEAARDEVIRFANNANTNVHLHQLDMAKPKSVSEFARQFIAQHDRVDILPRVIVVSSGGMLVQKLDSSDPMLVKQRARFDGTMVYAQNKRQQVVLCELWAQAYPEIVFASMHPGWADTPAVALSMPSFHHRMQGKLRSAEQGADTVVWLALTPNIRSFENGSFFQGMLNRLSIVFCCCMRQFLTVTGFFFLVRK
ncbi:unnamed protein product [Echinostoma caproni]|uniref:Dehydrogenase/reductase SDR family member 12 n=1 Tax=Echinostoma caproni TaxID=27848 RepID=A0A183AE30_9TREM|nr:unnamed protein product [Echinostoma caproni]